MTVLLVLLLASVHAYNNGLGRVPVRGWNTWCTQGTCGRDYCDEGEIREIADSMVANGMQAAGWNYVNLDDCWGGQRAADGSYQPDPDRFPSGIKNLTDYLHAKGFWFGLYTDAGEYTCSQGGRSYKIPGSYGHYDQDAQTFASWGVDFVKMDWCNTNINGTQLQPEVQYAEMSQSLNKTGRKIFFETCEWGTDDPWQWMRAYANSWRATGDHHDQWSSTASIIDQVASIAQYAGPGGWNYMDFLMTGGQGCSNNQPYQHCPGMTDDEYRTEFTIWVLAASPLIVATDVRNMTSIMKDILLNKEVLAIHQDSLGQAGQRVGTWNCSEAGACEIWARPLESGQKFAVLYNKGTASHGITLDFSIFGKGWVSASQRVTVRDVWAGKDLGTFNQNYTGTVVSHGVQALLLTLSPIVT
jgi:alpha-galactosidase